MRAPQDINAMIFPSLWGIGIYFNFFPDVILIHIFFGLWISIPFRLSTRSVFPLASMAEVSADPTDRPILHQPEDAFLIIMDMCWTQDLRHREIQQKSNHFWESNRQKWMETRWYSGNTSIWYMMPIYDYRIFDYRIIVFSTHREGCWKKNIQGYFYVKKLYHSCHGLQWAPCP